MPAMQANDLLKVEIPDFLKMESLSACSTPGHSPSPAPSAMGFGAPLIRRPSRKSTLTQQQKNQKRQRATQDQLNTLEFEFSRNPTPAAVVRERIASEINMTERSVQIWFQNRRAKIKNIAKKNIEGGDDYEAIPDSMRRYLAMQSLDSGKSFIDDDFFGMSSGAYANGGLLDPSSSKVMIYHLACRSLNIGAWKRIGQTQLDLVVFYSPSKAMLTYYIQADGSGFRIEYPFSSIDSITLDNGDGPDPKQTGGLVVKLNRPPVFTMDQASGWFQCRDFTEDQQATKVLTHYLGGHPKILSSQLAKLVSLESFIHRHDPMGFAAGMPGPEIISPPFHRPSSQPNHFIHPHRGQPAFATDGMFSMGPPPPRGHKRQRSRSVPVAVDFSQLRQPITPLPLVMHQHQHFHNHFNNNRTTPLYTGLPQQTQPLQRVSPTIRIDSSTAYIDMPPALSTSGTSPPSDFDLNSANSSDPSYLQTPFSHTSFNMHSIPESASSETPISAHSLHNGMQNTPDHFLHLQTPCPAPLQRSHSTSAIPQLANDPFSMAIKNELGSTQGLSLGMPSSTSDIFEPIDSDALLLQDDFAYDSFLSDPMADPFFDYSNLDGDVFDMLQMPMNTPAFEPTPATMTTTSNDAQTIQGKRHCAKQSLSLPLRLNMMEQGKANMSNYLKVQQQQPIAKGLITPMGEEFSFLAVSDDDVKEEEGEFSLSL